MTTLLNVIQISTRKGMQKIKKNRQQSSKTVKHDIGLSMIITEIYLCYYRYLFMLI